MSNGTSMMIAKFMTQEERTNNLTLRETSCWLYVWIKWTENAVTPINCKSV